MIFFFPKKAWRIRYLVGIIPAGALPYNSCRQTYFKDIITVIVEQGRCFGVYLFVDAENCGVDDEGGLAAVAIVVERVDLVWLGEQEVFVDLCAEFEGEGEEGEGARLGHVG